MHITLQTQREDDTRPAPRSLQFHFGKRYKKFCGQEKVDRRCNDGRLKSEFSERRDCLQNKKQVTEGQAQGSDKQQQDDNVEHRTPGKNRLHRDRLAAHGGKQGPVGFIINMYHCSYITHHCFSYSREDNIVNYKSEVAFLFLI